MNRDAYIKKVIRFIEKQLASNLDQLPSAFEIAGVHGAQTDWKLTVELRAIEESEVWFDCEELFRRLASEVNDKFASNKWYHGIVIEIPLNYLGELGAEAQLAKIQQERDNSLYNSVRLEKGRNNG